MSSQKRSAFESRTNESTATAEAVWALLMGRFEQIGGVTAFSAGMSEFEKTCMVAKLFQTLPKDAQRFVDANKMVKYSFGLHKQNSGIWQIYICPTIQASLKAASKVYFECDGDNSSVVINDNILEAFIRCLSGIYSIGIECLETKDNYWFAPTADVLYLFLGQTQSEST